MKKGFPSSLVLVFMLLVLLLAATLVACSAGPSTNALPQQSPGPLTPTTRADKPSWEAKWQNVVSAAKEEGHVVVYTTLGPESRTIIAKAFGEKTGINVEFVAGTPADLLAKLVAERRANLFLADLIIGGAGTTIVMKPYDMLDSIDPLLMLPEVTDPKLWRSGAVPIIDKDREILMFSGTFIRFIARNTDMVGDADVKSYADLLKPQYKGKILLQDPTMAGNGQSFVGTLAAQWGQDKAKEYLQNLVKQEPMITRDRRLQVEWVAKAKYPLTIASATEILADFMREGAPLAPVKIAEGGLISGGGGGMSIVSKRPDPNATTEFVNWLLSREGQTIFAKTFGQPSARADTPRDQFPAFYFPDADEKVVEQNEEFVVLQGEMGKAAKDIFQPLLK